MTARSLPNTPVPSISIFVRHVKKCKYRDDENYKSCRCPKHLRYSHDGRQIRRSAGTRFWQQAEDVRRKLESSFIIAASPTSQGVAGAREQALGSSPTTISKTVDLFIKDKRGQNVTEGLLKKYDRELGRFVAFMEQRTKFFPHEIAVADLTEFRHEWVEQYPSSSTRAKVQERLKAFLTYAYHSKLIDRVPPLSSIKVVEAPTLPLDDEEYKQLLGVIDSVYEDASKRVRVRAIIRCMRHSGLAIRDAVTLERNDLSCHAGVYRVITSRQKTGTHVSVPIQADVAREMLASHKLNTNKKYLFWNTGTGKEQSAVTNWQHDLREAFRAAGLPEGHPHQLRDTFAVGLLQKGVPIEEVSKMLGHTSIKTTEKHYAPWIKARQERLDALVMATWG
jgi:integrase/recombinase XerD